MIKLSPSIRKSKPNADGSYGLKIQIGLNRTQVFLPTPYKIDSLNQWQNGKVIRHPNAKWLNDKLRDLIIEYETVLEANSSGFDTATEARDYILSQQNKCETIKSYGEKYLAKLQANGQTSYAQNMGYTLKSLTNTFGERLRLDEISSTTLASWQVSLAAHNQSSTTINIRMSHLKALLNAAVNEGLVEYKIFPFRNYRMPQKNVRDLCISPEELAALRNAKFEGVSEKRLSVARDLFMLSFYCAGINLTDILSASLDGDTLTFIRKKTATKKKGIDKQVSMTIQPEAREIINKYIGEDGKLHMGYHYAEYGQFRSFVTKSLNRLGEKLGFEKKLMFYSARKTISSKTSATCSCVRPLV